MKKLVNMFLIVLMLLALTGCEIPWLNPNPQPDPDTETPTEGLNQEDLWDFLKNKCFITEYGILDYAYYFKGSDEFVISADHLNYGESYYFSDLIDFKYDGNNTYILEYENNYDAFPHGIFVLIFDPKESNRLTIYQDMYGDRVSVDLFEDEPLSAEEIVNILKNYKYWYYDSYQEHDYDDYFVYIDDCCNDEFYEVLMGTTFFRKGEIVEAEYLGVTLYKVSIYFHGMSDGIDPGYDYYWNDHQLAISPYVEYIGYDTEMMYEDLRFFHPETGLSLDELFKDLYGRSYYDDYGTIYTFETRADGTYHLLIDWGKAGVNDWQIKDFEFIGRGRHRYQLTCFELGSNAVFKISYNYLEPEHIHFVAYSTCGDYSWDCHLTWD